MDATDEYAANSLDLDALAVSDRFRLFNFTRREDHVAYLWVLRELRYHGDFDWPGVAIAASVMARHGAQPWRMSASDYALGVRADADYVALSGPPQPTPWDPALSETMTAAGRAVYEETVADALIADLATA